jgi:major membrane immunogen (membrane-anchored lipoprotein)
MKVRLGRAALGLLAALLLTGCAADPPTYKDGVYTGVSGEDDRGAYGEVTVTIASGRVTECRFVTWQADGSIKDEDYGKVNGEIENQSYYEKAQLAVRAMARYAAQFEETGALSGVDAVSGATIAYDQFIEAAEAALAEAQ